VLSVTARQQVNAAAKRARGSSSEDEWIRGSSEEAEAEAEADSDEVRDDDSDLSDSNPFRAASDSDDGTSIHCRPFLQHSRNI
jgi:hypothetical protein